MESSWPTNNKQYRKRHHRYAQIIFTVVYQFIGIAFLFLQHLNTKMFSFLFPKYFQKKNLGIGQIIEIVKPWLLVHLVVKEFNSKRECASMVVSTNVMSLILNKTYHARWKIAKRHLVFGPMLLHVYPMGMTQCVVQASKIRPDGVPMER